MPATNGAASFPPVSYAAWQAGVEAELGPDGVTRRLRATTEDGIAIEPLYAPGGPGEGAARNLAGRVAGLLPAERAGWTIRQRFPATASREMLETAIACGVQSIEFTWKDTEEFKALFAIMPHLGRAGVETSLEGNFARSLMGAGVGLDEFGTIAFGVDPVASFLHGDSLSGELVHDVGMVGLLSQWNRPGDVPLRASGDLFFNAGATSGMTLGLTLSVALACLRAVEAVGTDPGWAAGALEIRLPCSPRFFESAAMLRAARLVWARILEASGISPTPLRLVAISGRRTLTRHDPWNNALRNTAVAFAAAIGGADILQLLPHDVRNAESSAAALRLARTTGLILQEEAHLGRVLDPAEGSWFLESLTAGLAEEAWGELRRLDAAGGIVASIASGDLSRRLAEAAAARHGKVRAGRHPIIGVTEHPAEGEVVVPSAAEIADAAVPSLFPFRPDAQPYESGTR
jgi:methylmalonyl-CoA mutase